MANEAKNQEIALSFNISNSFQEILQFKGRHPVTKEFGRYELYENENANLIVKLEGQEIRKGKKHWLEISKTTWSFSFDADTTIHEQKTDVKNFVANGSTQESFKIKFQNNVPETKNLLKILKIESSKEKNIKEYFKKLNKKAKFEGLLKALYNENIEVSSIRNILGISSLKYKLSDLKTNNILLGQESKTIEVKDQKTKAHIGNWSLVNYTKNDVLTKKASQIKVVHSYPYHLDRYQYTCELEYSIQSKDQKAN